MSELTSKERVARQLEHKSVDRIAVYEQFWGETIRNWTQKGLFPEGEDPVYHFDLDLSVVWTPNYMLDPFFKDQTVAEDEDTLTYLNGNGATLRKHKKHASTPEHINFAIKTREDWEEKAKPLLKSVPIPDRIKADLYVSSKKRANEANKFFCYAGIPVFECLHPICGHEDLLMGMALDPDWVREMSETYARLNIDMMEYTFNTYGLPDGVWFYEDMGFKGRPFMSPAMYGELIQPSHKKIFDYVHSRGLKVIMHSCGFVEPLLPGAVEAGIDCLQAMEVKAGMDLLRIYKNYGEKIALMGGLDVRPVANNDLEGARREVESKVPFVMRHNGYIFHSDHSIPESTNYESYVKFLELAREFGTY